jgi:ribosomal protein L9
MMSNFQGRTNLNGLRTKFRKSLRDKKNNHMHCIMQRYKNGVVEWIRHLRCNTRISSSSPAGSKIFGAITTRNIWETLARYKIKLGKKKWFG